MTITRVQRDPLISRTLHFERIKQPEHHSTSQLYLRSETEQEWMAQLDGLTGRGGVSTCSLLRSSLAVPQALPQEGLSPQELPVLCPRAAERSFPSGLARHGCISSILYYLYSVSHLSLMCFLSCLSFSLTEMMRYLTKIQLGERCFLAQLLPIH